MTDELWLSFSQREQDGEKVNWLADRLRKRRRKPPPGPDDGLSPLDRLLKANYPALWDDPDWSNMHENAADNE